MPTLREIVLTFIVLLSLSCSAKACLWDYDTLREERQRFPDTLELITGKFLRHSTEFYRWRIEDRKKKLAAQPGNFDNLDDLAVAYEKTGNHEKAIETMLGAEKIDSHRYETKANLATFYVHLGDLPNSLKYIREALAINPDAHFGRERYQMWLIEYMQAMQVNGKTVLPLQSDGTTDLTNHATKGRPHDFHEFIQQRLDNGKLNQSELEKAITGVQGMMRFANFENPVLLEVLGDLLLAGRRPPELDAKRLAARCYLKASFAIDDFEKKLAYRELARRAIMFQTRTPIIETQLSLEELERDFRQELADAEKWYDDVKAHELQWIHDGKDADMEYDLQYRNSPPVADVNPFIDVPKGVDLAILGKVIAVFVVVIATITWRIRRYFVTR